MKNVEMPNRPWDRLESLDPRRHAVAAVVGVSAIVIVSLFVSGRGAPARIAPPASAAGSPQATSTSAASVMVHVAGAVRFPGVYELHEGARVADAIALAGGPRPSADLDLLNLAQQIADGMKIEVSRRGAPPAAPSAAGAPHASPGAPISLNAAEQIALEAIPGIGPVRAAAILAYREEHGGFTTVEELLEVSGIGPATLEALRPYVTL